MSARGQALVALTAAAVVIATTVGLARTTGSDDQTAVRAAAGQRAVEVVVVAAVGDRGVEIRRSDPAGVTEVRLEPTMTDMGHAYPPVAATAVDRGSGRYRAETRFDMAGRWELTVVVDDGAGTERAVLPFSVRP
jgi:hypothetical protein